MVVHLMKLGKWRAGRRWASISFIRSTSMMTGHKFHFMAHAFRPSKADRSSSVAIIIHIKKATLRLDFGGLNRTQFQRASQLGQLSRSIFQPRNDLQRLELGTRIRIHVQTSGRTFVALLSGHQDHCRSFSEFQVILQRLLDFGHKGRGFSEFLRPKIVWID